MIGIFIFILMVGIPWILPTVLSYKAKDEDIPRLINILIKEDKIIFPIGILMLGYQIYKSGQWGPTPQTTNYIVIFEYIFNVIVILITKFNWRVFRKQGRELFILYFAIIFTPFITILFLLLMPFNK